MGQILEPLIGRLSTAVNVAIHLVEVLDPWGGAAKCRQSGGEQGD